MSSTGKRGIEMFFDFATSARTRTIFSPPERKRVALRRDQALREGHDMSMQAALPIAMIPGNMNWM